ncbi:hypothetical protein OG562_22190 [Streptomyces sp. NBC_01275]|uniref:hypothetical protein n=1 Tax=Streptomyces sp. NBC_01275 TaxID=2903807 RepID=UPI00224EDDE0|nr:hypothetical protein [Streptomyces sp. NBC_01275]MCX4763623.1 hypothetical protein [Streptomyces sp. NBC_01275]
MEIETLIAQLADPAGQLKASELQPLTDELKRMGPPAFDAVVAAWRREEFTAWQLGRFLDGFDERSAHQYAAAAADPDRSLAAGGFAGLLRLRVESDAGLRALVGAFTRRDGVPSGAADYARLLADAFGPRLRRLRRDPAESPKTRRAALAALAAGGGADALDPRDRATIERLIRVKIPHEIPELPAPILSAWWLAVPGASYEGLFEALGLHDRRPITVRAGVEATEGSRALLELTGSDGARRTVGRVFVTPELDGWRLVYGPLRLLLGEPWDPWMESVERLSAHCGQAQFFFVDDHGGSDLWVVAEKGRVIRRYTAEDDPEWVGDPLPWETLATEDRYYDPEFDDWPANAGTDGAETACAHLSVDPGEVGADTRIRGHGWLALTEPDVGHGAFPGTLPL